MLNGLADIINDLSLPVVFGTYEKGKFGNGELAFGSHQEKSRLIHDVAAIDCLIRADRWLARFAPDELATAIHEDGTPAKPLIKASVRFARDAELLKAHGYVGESAPPGLPLKRIIDTVHFAEKAEARPLQLADLCAFILGRGLKDKPIPEHVTKIILRHLDWIIKDDKAAKAARVSSVGAGEQPS